MTGQGVRKLEKAEADGAITLNTLRRLADGLDCDVRYVFVPRTSLVEQVLRRTHEVTGAPTPSLPHIAAALAEPQTLAALSTVFAHVNKRGLW